MIKLQCPWLAILLSSLVVGCALDEPVPAGVESVEEGIQVTGCPTAPPETFGPPEITYGGRPTFKWHGVSGADAYTLVVLDDENPGWRHHAPGLTGTTYSPGVELPYKRLRWKVKGEGSCAGPYSPSVYFTPVPWVSPPSQRVRILSPVGTTPETRPWFEWTHVPGAESYTLFVSYPDGRFVFPDVTLTATRYRFEHPLAPGPYSIVVRPNSRGGHGNDTRAFGNFTVGSSSCPRPTRPFVISPDGPSTTRPTFEWICVPGCTSYTVVVQHWPRQQFVHAAIVPPVVNERRYCEYTPPIDFERADHGVKVKCDDACGPGAYGPYLMFTPQ